MPRQKIEGLVAGQGLHLANSACGLGAPQQTLCTVLAVCSGAWLRTRDDVDRDTDLIQHERLAAVKYKGSLWVLGGSPFGQVTPSLDLLGPLGGAYRCG